MTNLQVLEKLRARLLSRMAKIDAEVGDGGGRESAWIDGKAYGVEQSIEILDELVKIQATTTLSQRANVKNGKLI